jgi:hypothetical protein
MHVEQEEGGALARRHIEQQLPDVLAQLDVVERVAIPTRAPGAEPPGKERREIGRGRLPAPGTG